MDTKGEENRKENEGGRKGKKEAEKEGGKREKPPTLPLAPRAAILAPSPRSMPPKPVQDRPAGSRPRTDPGVAAGSGGRPLPVPARGRGWMRAPAAPSRGRWRQQHRGASRPETPLIPLARQAASGNSPLYPSPLLLWLLFFIIFIIFIIVTIFKAALLPDATASITRKP